MKISLNLIIIASMNLKKEKKDKVIRQIESHLNRRWYKKAAELISHYKIGGYTKSASSIKLEYGVTKTQLEKGEIQFIEMDNPYYKCAGNMRCYLIREVEDKLTTKAIRRNKITEILN